MTDFKIGDLVRIIDDASTPEVLVVRKNDNGVILCVSECGSRSCWEADYSLELVNRPDPQADIKQAIREVLLSDEFMKAFAAAFRSEAVSQYTFSDEVRSLEHPIPGVNQPMRSDPSKEATNEPA